MRMWRHYTSEEISFVRKNIKGKTYEEMRAMFNKRFGLSLTKKQFDTLMYKHKFKNGLGTINGYPPANKGMRWHYTPEHKRYRAIGNERIDQGYVVVKVTNQRPWVWKGKHIVLWEAKHGKVPKGHKVVFLDKNRRNFDLNNLALITNGELFVMNHLKLFTTDRDTTLANIAMVKMMCKITRLKEKTFIVMKNKRMLFQSNSGTLYFVIKHKGRFISVWKTKTGKQIKVRSLKSRATRAQAQRELYEYAQSKGWQRI